MISPAQLRALLGSAYLVQHGDAFAVDVAAHSPVAGVAPALVLVDPTDPAGARVLGALVERRADLAFHELVGRRVAVALVPADALPALAVLVDAQLASSIRRRVELPEARLLVVAGGGASARVVVLHAERVSA